MRSLPLLSATIIPKFTTLSFAFLSSDFKLKRRYIVLRLPKYVGMYGRIHGLKLDISLSELQQRTVSASRSEEGLSDGDLSRAKVLCSYLI